MKITGDQNQQISFISCRSKNVPAAFHYVSVVKCLGRAAVFKLGGSSIVRGFLGFAFQFFLLNDFFLLSCASWFGETQHMILPCLPCTLPIENFKFCSPFFFNCLNLRVLYRHWTLAVQEVSPNWSHTESKESIVFQFQTVSKRLFFLTRGLCFASWFLFPWRKWMMAKKQTVFVFSFTLELLQCFLH